MFPFDILKKFTICYPNVRCWIFVKCWMLDFCLYLNLKFFQWAVFLPPSFKTAFLFLGQRNMMAEVGLSTIKMLVFLLVQFPFDNQGDLRLIDTCQGVQHFDGTQPHLGHHIPLPSSRNVVVDDGGWKTAYWKNLSFKYRQKSNI